MINLTEGEQDVPSPDEILTSSQLPPSSALVPLRSVLTPTTGPDSLSIWAARLLAAQAQQQTRGHTEGIAGYQEAVQVCKDIHGDRHPLTLAAREDLALPYLQARRYSEAHDLCETTAEACAADSEFGSHHPETLLWRGLQVYTLAQQGKVKDATELLTQALDQWEPRALPCITRRCSG